MKILPLVKGYNRHTGRLGTRASEGEASEWTEWGPHCKDFTLHVDAHQRSCSERGPHSNLGGQNSLGSGCQLALALATPGLAQWVS